MRDLLSYAKTETQRQYIQAVTDHGSNRKAAKALGVHHSTVDKAISAVKRAAVNTGYAPEIGLVHPAPEGIGFSGASIYRQATKDQPGGWFKYKTDPKEAEEQLAAILEAFKSDIPKEKPAKGPRQALNASLLNCYIITDYHLGMKAWHRETGADWDIRIAENLLTDWFKTAVNQSPDAETGVLALLGDFLHWDGLEAVTPTSKHVLDADTRFPKVVRVAIRVLRRVVQALLAKHNRVHIKVAEGNHDIASSIWLRELLAALYDGESRVEVDCNPDPYYAFEFGKVGLFFHHGHKRKPQDVDSIFAAKFREIFGRTEHCYAHMGHYHHDMVLETNLMRVEQHRTLAAPDSHASRGGYMSGRDGKVITYHKEHGRVGEVIISPEMVE